MAMGRPGWLNKLPLIAASRHVMQLLCYCYNCVMTSDVLRSIHSFTHPESVDMSSWQEPGVCVSNIN